MLFVSPDLKEVLELIAPYLGKYQIKLTRRKMVWFAEVKTK